jgi:hypothetical protein
MIFFCFSECVVVSPAACILSRSSMVCCHNPLATSVTYLCSLKSCLLTSEVSDLVLQ